MQCHVCLLEGTEVLTPTGECVTQRHSPHSSFSLRPINPIQRLTWKLDKNQNGGDGGWRMVMLSKKNGQTHITNGCRNAP